MRTKLTIANLLGAAGVDTLATNRRGRTAAEAAHRRGMLVLASRLEQ